MARGWESKSVESQQADAVDEKTKHRRPLTAEQAAIARKREGILLSRKRILDQLQAATNSQHKQMLEAALADLDARLAALS